MSEGFKGSIDLIHLKRRRKKQILKAFNSTHPVRAEYEFVIRDLGMTYTMDANRFVGSPEAVMTGAKKCATIVDVSSMVTESTIVDGFPPHAVGEPTVAPSTQSSGAEYEDVLFSEATKYYHRRLEATVLSSLKRNAQMRGEKRIMCAAADLSYRKLLLLRYFNTWINLATFLPPKDFGDLFGAARAHHRIQLLRHCFHRWLNRITHRRQVTIDRYLADKFFGEVLGKRLLIQYFQMWLRALRCVHQAKQFRSRKLLYSVLSSWVTLSRSRTEHRRMQRLAVLHDIKATHLRWFTKWFRQLSSQLNDIVKVRQFTRKRLLHCAFRMWYAHHTRLVEISRIIQQNELQRNDELLRITWYSWRSWMQCARKQLAIALEFHQWNEHSSHRKMILFWAHWAKIHKRDRIFVEINRKTSSFKRQQIIILHWHAWASSHAEIRGRAGYCLQIAHERLRVVALWGALRQWKAKFKLQQMMTTAESFNSHMTLRRVLHAWRKLPMLKERKLRLKNVASDFRATTLKMHYFCMWSVERRESSRYRKLDALALCRWSLRLQARVWSAWRQWMLYRSQERARTKEALERYQQRTACDSLRGWIYATLEARRVRQLVLCRRHWDCDFRKFRITANAATRWYWRVLTKQNHPCALSAGCSGPNLLCTSANCTIIECKNSAFVSGPSRPLLIDAFPNEHPDNLLPSLPKPLCPEFVLPYLLEKGISIQDGHIPILPYNFVGALGDASIGSAETDSNFIVLNESINWLQAKMDYLRILKMRFRLERFLTNGSHFPSQLTDTCVALRKQLKQEKIQCKKQLFCIISFIQRTFFTG